MKKKRVFSIFDLVISVCFSLLLSIYILPKSVCWILNSKNIVSFRQKQELLLAGIKYLKHNDSKVIYISELLDLGYLEENNELEEKDCSLQLSKVIKIQNEYTLDLKCSNNEDLLVFSEQKGL